MPKNTKVTQREHTNEPVTESVADLLSLEHPMDYKSSQMSMGLSPGSTAPVKPLLPSPDPDAEDGRPAWNNKLEYILAQVGFSVGLGNVWRFPYLCQKNGGGAYLVPYFILLLLIGIPLFFLELAVGQRIRRGSIGVWNYVCPQLGGIGVSSLMVSIIPQSCMIGLKIFLPLHIVIIVVEPECERSSATTYFWYRQTLNITSTIDDSGGLNWKMTLSLFVAWILVCLAVIKGIQSSGKVMYFSSLFPYVVLFCFLVQGLLLKGAVDGIAHMFTPKLEKMLEPQVWREAATQVFFALGLGFGGVIAFSSYNKRDNNCHFDAALVSIINFVTSILATLVVFAVLGFKANVMNEKCVVEEIIPLHINFSHLSAQDYAEMYGVIKTVKEDSFGQLGLDSCVLEDELNKAVQGTGLAFIAFTEAMTHFPASPFWSVMFFFMLINLGLGSMIGTMTGITTPILDAFKIRKEILCVVCCVIAFLLGLLFVQRSGNYFVAMFDDYSAGLPLTVVVILENISVAWIYGTKRFMQDLEDMLGFRPYAFYYYMWQYVSPAILVVLITSTIIEMAVIPAGYNVWVQSEVSASFLLYPPWALAMAYALIVVAMLPLPMVFIARQFNLISDGSNKLSVSYCKGMMKDISNLEEQDEQRFILSKNPSEAPSPMPPHRAYLGPGGTQEMTNTNYGTSAKTGYQNIVSPESEL
uniref:Transporter n=1 Tax=Monopterus albus TaxID=43700 RepID=A0A3Q3KFM7_MONAL